MFAWLLASALAADAPPVVQSWADFFDATYPHYDTLDDAWGAEETVGPTCPDTAHGLPLSIRGGRDPEAEARFQADPEGFVAGCTALRHTDWLLRVDAKPKDQRIFSALRIEVHPTAHDKPAEDELTQALAHGAFAAKDADALIPSGSTMVRLRVPCGAGAMALYEVHDLIAALSQRAPVESVAWSPCGRVNYERKDAAWFAEQALEPREFWGMDFPEARDRARKNLGPVAR